MLEHGAESAVWTGECIMNSKDSDLEHNWRMTEED